MAFNVDSLTLDPNLGTGTCFSLNDATQDTKQFSLITSSMIVFMVVGPVNLCYS